MGPHPGEGGGAAAACARPAARWLKAFAAGLRLERAGRGAAGGVRRRAEAAAARVAGGLAGGWHRACK